MTVIEDKLQWLCGGENRGGPRQKFGNSEFEIALISLAAEQPCRSLCSNPLSSMSFRART